MVTEAAVVGVLLDSHDLDAVVAVLGHARQYVLTELVVGAHLLFLLAHANVALIDQQRVGGGTEGTFFPLIRSLGIPNLCAEDFGLLVLHHTVGPGGNTFAFATFPMDFQLEEVTMLHGRGWQLDFPYTATLFLLHAELLLLFPAVEVADEVDFRSVRSPFTEHPSPLFRAVQTEVEVAGSDVAQALLAGFG